MPQAVNWSSMAPKCWRSLVPTTTLIRPNSLSMATAPPTPHLQWCRDHQRDTVSHHPQSGGPSGLADTAQPRRHFVKGNVSYLLAATPGWNTAYGAAQPQAALTGTRISVSNVALLNVDKSDATAYDAATDGVLLLRYLLTSVAPR